jgi:transposase-like protein/transposase Tn5 family protein
VDLILDARGAFAWSRGPTSAPILSIAALRITPDGPHPTQGRSPRGSPTDPADPPAEHGSCDSLQSRETAPLTWPIDPAAWATAQFATAQLGHSGRTARLVMLAEQIARDPGSSLPRATQTWGDLKGAYRLLDRPEVTFQTVAAPHWQLTRQQAERGRFLILDDTTEIDYGSKRQAAGLGPVGRGTGHGFLLHSAVVVPPDDEWVVGLAGQILFHRRPVPKGETLTQKLGRDRESAVWGQLIELVGPPPATAQWVHVMDRGADDFEVFCRAGRIGADWIGRVKSRNRRVRDEAGHEGPLSDVLTAAPVAGGYILALRSRPGQPARQARVEVAFAPVTALTPQHAPASLKALAPEPIPQWVVWAREVDPPPKLKEPIDWVLLTSLPVQDLEGAMEVIGYYEKRWVIEEWHKALKTGCQVERRQLHTSPRLEALTGVLSVVAVRLLQMRQVGRREPNRAAGELAPPHYVSLVHRARRGRGRPEDWTIRDFIRGLAGLGGFLGRKSDGEPGWITIWRGWDALHWMLEGAHHGRESPFY